MRLNFLSIIFLLGSFNGFSIAIYLFFTKDDKRQAKYFLGILIAALSFDMLESVLYLQKILTRANNFYGHFWIYTIGPSLYFYIKTSLHFERVSSKRIFRHYLPAIVILIINIILFSLREKPFVSATFSTFEMTIISQIFLATSRYLSIPIFWIYFYFAHKKLEEFQQNTFETQNLMSLNHLRIIKYLSKALLFMSILIVSAWLLIFFDVALFKLKGVMILFYLTEIFLVIACYWGGLTAYHRTKVIFVNEQNNVSENELNKNSQLIIQITPEEMTEYSEILAKSMKEDKIYLDSELTLAKLTALTQIPSRKISAVLNRHLKKGFNDYVNEFRVEEVKQRLLDPKNKNLTITAIAFDSGFNSVTTFQRVFKTKTGLTPKGFLSQNLKKS